MSVMDTCKLKDVEITTEGSTRSNIGFLSNHGNVTLRKIVQYVRDFMPVLDTCKLETVGIKT